MTATHTHLTVQPRAKTGKAVRVLRRNGLVPANVYGAGVTSQAVEVSYKELNPFLRDTGESEIIDLQIAGEDKTRPVLLGAVQTDPVSRDVLHVDFRQVDLTKEVTAEVALVFEGEPAIVKSGQGILLELLDSIEVTALPNNLPNEFVVDVSGLQEVGDQITIADLQISEDVVIENDPEQLVCKLEEAKQQEEEEEAPAEGDESAEEAAETTPTEETATTTEE